MRGVIRWIVWGTALSLGAILGVAAAGGEDGDFDRTPQEWIGLLSHPEWEVRARATEALRKGGEEAYKALFTCENPHPEAQFRIALLKQEMAPLYGGWNHALEAGRTALDTGDMEGSVRYFLIAAEKKKALRADPWLADVCRRAWRSLAPSARDTRGMQDWEMFLCGEFEELAARFPDSELREKSLFLARRYEEVLADYPEGAYAPLARYSLTAGHPYFAPPSYLEIENPAEEVQAWPEFLRRHPGHPGSDDAAYRLGRALEKLGRYREAAVWLMRSARLPDGEFRWKGPLRAVWVVDAMASEADLTALASKDAPARIREMASLTLGIRALRRSAFGEARARLEAFVLDYPGSRFREDALKRLEDLKTVLLPEAGRQDGETGSGDEALYELGRYFYHRLLSLYNPIWEGNRVNYFAYEVNCLGRSHAFRNPSYFEAHNNYLQAAAYFDRLAAAHPDSPLRPKALYSAGTAFMKSVSLNRFSVFTTSRDEMLRESLRRYREVVKKHPRSDLTDASLRMIGVVKRMLAETSR